MIDLRFLHLKILILKRHSLQTKCPTSLHSPQAFTSCPRPLLLCTGAGGPNRGQTGFLGDGASGCRLANMGGGWEGAGEGSIPRGPRAGQADWGQS